MRAGPEAEGDGRRSEQRKDQEGQKSRQTKDIGAEMGCK